MYDVLILYTNATRKVPCIEDKIYINIHIILQHAFVLYNNNNNNNRLYLI